MAKLSPVSKHHCISIPGSFLQHGFSIYLLIINYAKGNYYYVGMTGDNYYRSARAGFYRLAGHLDIQNERSTQNQLLTGLINMLKTGSDKAAFDKKIKEVDLCMYHFPIKGYQYSGVVALAKDDGIYRKRKSAVAELEKAIISNLREKVGKDFVFNKTKTQKEIILKNKAHIQILEDVLSLAH